MPTNVRDPRSIVTPEAFEIDPSLLGLPLARPSRRLWALLIDLAIVGILTVLLSDVQLLLWGVIALVLVRLGFKRTSRPVGAAAGMLLRGSAGCLGIGILATVAIVWAASRMDEGEREAALSRVVEETARRSVPRIPGAYADAATPGEAAAVMAGILDGLAGLPLSPSARRDILRASVPPDAPWAAQADSLVDDVIARGDAGTAGGVATPEGGVPEDVARLDDAEVLAELARAGTDSSAAGAPRREALRRRAASIVAADTLAALATQLEEMGDSLAGEREARAELEGELEASRGGLGAFADLLGDVWDQLGSAIGLWSLYFTLLSTAWKGQTVGKKVMGVRVLRLDGLPLGWWSSFERAGGYVAGLATGLLGFAQVFWDPNRQCIHDKIVGTVVVVAGAERIPGAWEEAWGRKVQR